MGSSQELWAVVGIREVVGIMGSNWELWAVVGNY